MAKIGIKKSPCEEPNLFRLYEKWNTFLGAKKKSQPNSF
jgi:hypothetical protein